MPNSSSRAMGQAIRRKAELGLVDILDKGKADADLPWEAFTFEHLR